MVIHIKHPIEPRAKWVNLKELTVTLQYDYSLSVPGCLSSNMKLSSIMVVCDFVLPKLFFLEGGTHFHLLMSQIFLLSFAQQFYLPEKLKLGSGSASILFGSIVNLAVVLWVWMVKDIAYCEFS